MEGRWRIEGGRLMMFKQEKEGRTYGRKVEDGRGQVHDV